MDGGWCRWWWVGGDVYVFVCHVGGWIGDVVGSRGVGGVCLGWVDRWGG